MKKIIYPLFALIAAFFATGHLSAQTQNLPPIRTVDHFPVTHPVTPVLPMKAGAEGGNNLTQPARSLNQQQGVGGLKTAAMPIKQGASGASGVSGASAVSGASVVSGSSKTATGSRPGGQTGTAATIAPIKTATTGSTKQ
jgi:hypothetical protein